MSYVLVITHDTLPEKDSDSWEYMEELVENDVREPSADFLEFMDEVLKKYPCMTSLPEEESMDGVWSDGPVLDNVQRDTIRLGVVNWELEEVVPFLIKTANKKGFVVFDAQLEKIYRPNSTKGKK